MINSGPLVFHFWSRAVYIAASTFAPLAHILKATAIVLKVLFYIRSKRAELILSLKFYQRRILASNLKWEMTISLICSRDILCPFHVKETKHNYIQHH